VSDQQLIDGRFKANAIVVHLLDVAGRNGCDMNTLACMEFSDDDRVQLAQLIGYSLGGFGSLSYVSDEAYARAANQDDRPDYAEVVALRAALAHARQEAINAKGIAGVCVKALTQAEGFVSATNRKAWGSDEGIGSTLPMIRDTLQRAKIFGKGNPQ
jgi:hypothetical protein